MVERQQWKFLPSTERKSFSAVEATPENEEIVYPYHTLPRNKPIQSENRSSPTDDFCFETLLSGRFALKVYKASVTRLNVDVIVNAANDTLIHGGGVAKIIASAAGYDLEKESRDFIVKHGPLRVGLNTVTTAGKLPYLAVIHAVGPMWSVYRDKVECLDDLYDCIYNILDTCKKNHYKTVAMTAISAGVFGVPKELCADMYVHAAANFSSFQRPGDCPKELHIIDVDISILRLVEESVQRWRKDPDALNHRLTLPKFLEDNPHHAGKSYNNDDQHFSSDNQRQDHSGDEKAHDFKTVDMGQTSRKNDQDQDSGAHGFGEDSRRNDHGENFKRNDQVQDCRRYDKSHDSRRYDQGERYDNGQDCRRNDQGQDLTRHDQSQDCKRYYQGQDYRRYDKGQDGRRKRNSASLEFGIRLEKMKDELFPFGVVAKQFMIENQVKVMIYKEDIRRVRNMDAIVCGMSKSFEQKGFMADAIKTEGGDVYTKSYQQMISKHRKRNIKYSDVFKCDGGNLGAKYVAHAVIRRVVDADAREIEDYQDCIASVLYKAQRNGWKKIAIPLIGTGIIQKNKQKLKLCGIALLRAIKEFIGIDGSKHKVAEIHLVNNKHEVNSALVEVFDKESDQQVAAGQTEWAIHRVPDESIGNDSASQSTDHRNCCWLRKRFALLKGPTFSGNGGPKSNNHTNEYSKLLYPKSLPTDDKRWPRSNAQTNNRSKWSFSKRHSTDRCIGLYSSDQVTDNRKRPYSNDRATDHNSGPYSKDMPTDYNRGPYLNNRATDNSRGPYLNDRATDHSRGPYSNDRTTDHSRGPYSKDMHTDYNRRPQSNDRVTDHNRRQNSNGWVTDHSSGPYSTGMTTDHYNQDKSRNKDERRGKGRGRKRFGKNGSFRDQSEKDNDDSFEKDKLGAGERRQLTKEKMHEGNLVIIDD